MSCICTAIAITRRLFRWRKCEKGTVQGVRVKYASTPLFTFHFLLSPLFSIPFPVLSSQYNSESFMSLLMPQAPVFVRQAYHKTHCLFLLKKLHRTFARGTPLDGQIMPTHHTEHCVEQALKPPGFREHAVQLSYTKFPYCGKPGGFNVAWKIGVGLLGWTDD